jgi:deoxyribose-phosphate aldolase
MITKRNVSPAKHYLRDHEFVVSRAATFIGYPLGQAAATTAQNQSPRTEVVYFTRAAATRSP